MKNNEEKILFIQKLCAFISLFLIIMVNTVYFDHAYFIHIFGIFYFPVVLIAILFYFISLYINRINYLLFLFILLYTINMVYELMGIYGFLVSSKFQVRTFKEMSRYQPMTFKDVDLFWSGVCWYIYSTIQLSTIVTRSNIYAKVQRTYLFFTMNVIYFYCGLFLSYIYPRHHRYMFWSMEFSFYFISSIFILMVGTGIADIIYHRKNRLYLELFLLIASIFFWSLSILLKYVFLAK